MPFVINDLDDIETQLYNQVFHSQNDYNEAENEALNNKGIEGIIEQDPQQSYCRYFSTNAEMQKQPPLNNIHHFNARIEPQQQEPVNQYIFVNSYKNYVVQPDYLTRKQLRNRKRKERRENKLLKQISRLDKLQQSKSQRSMNTLKTKTVTSPKQPRQNKKKTKKSTLDNRKQPQSPPSPPPPPPLLSNSEVNSVKESEVIAVSDSEDEDESCVLIPPNWPQVSVYDSDEEPPETENKNENNEEVFVIKQVKPEVIILEDEESCDKRPSDLVSEKNNSHKERGEVLNTPESNSNDFIDNVELQNKQFNFNFGLHGKDFRVNDGKFVKPANPAETTHETYETESSCSTTDINPLAPVVFHEVEFPKEDIFCERNIENFGSFITPQRQKNSSKKTASSTPKSDVNINEKASGDSSSESDLEEHLKNRSLNKNSKRLPNLSPLVKNVNVEQMAAAKRKLNESAKKKRIRKKKKSGEIEETTKISTSTDQNPKEDAHQDNNKEENANVESAKGSKADDTPTRKNKNKRSFSENESNVNEDIQKENADNLETSPAIENADRVTENLKNKECERTEEDLPKKRKKRRSLSEKTVDKQTSNDENKKDSDLNKSQDNSENVSLDKSLFHGLEVIDETFDSAGENLEKQPPTMLISSDSDNEDDLTINLSKSNNETLDQNENLPKHVLTTFKDYWTEDKEKFYKTPVNVDSFSVTNIKKSMSSDPKLWMISRLDKNPVTCRQRRIICRRCRQDGHLSIRCPLRFEQPKCSLCGNIGHQEPRCPNKMCTQCGKSSDYLTTYCKECFHWKDSCCEICKAYGHCADNCPDLWRRYHLTTKNGPLKKTNGPTLKPQEGWWCSGCAGSGHLENSCRSYRPNYSLSNPEIYSYKDVYIEENNIEKPQVEQFQMPQQKQNYPKILSLPNNLNLINTVKYLERFPQVGPLMLAAPLALQQRPQLQQHPKAYSNFLQNTCLPPGPPPQQYYPINPQVVPFNQQIPFTPPVMFNQPLPNYISFDDAPPNQNQIYQNVSPPNTMENQNFNVIESVESRPRASTTQISNKSERRPSRRNKNDGKGAKVKPFKGFQNDREINSWKNHLDGISRSFSKLEQMEMKDIKKYLRQKKNFRLLNMILFGRFQFGDGKRHMKRIKSYVTNPRQIDDRQKLNELFSSYNYIFSKQKKPDINYDELISKVRL